MFAKRTLLALFSLLALNLACSNEGTLDVNLTKQALTGKVATTNAPVAAAGDPVVTKVVVSVSDVSVHRSSSAGVNDAGWTTVRLTNATDLDLTALQSNADLLLGTGPLPAGHYQQLRYTIASATATYTNDTTCTTAAPCTQALTVPSGAIKLNLDVTIVDGTKFGVTLAYDSVASTVNTTNWTLTPVVKVKEVYIINADGSHTPAPKGSGNNCNTGDTCAASNEKCCGASSTTTGKCIDVLADKNNCGECAKQCLTNQSCSNGSCL